MKRKLSILLTAVATLAVFTACGRGGDTVTDTTAQQTEVAPTVEETPITEPALTEEVAEVPVEETVTGPHLCDTFVQMITDTDLNGMTGEFLVDYLVNYNSDPAGYDAQMVELFGADYEDEDAFAAANPELIENGFGYITTTPRSNRIIFAIGYTDYDTSVPHPVFDGHIYIYDADWEAMKATWVAGETTYEEIVAEVGDPGVFGNIEYRINKEDFNVCIYWGSRFDATDNYGYRGLNFDENGVLKYI